MARAVINLPKEILGGGLAPLFVSITRLSRKKNAFGRYANLARCCAEIGRDVVNATDQLYVATG